MLATEPLAARNASKQTRETSLHSDKQVARLGNLIYKYMIPVSSKQYLSSIDSEYIVISTDDVEIPWKLMHYGNHFLFLGHSVGRKIQIRTGLREVNRPRGNKIRALFVANPSGDFPEAEREVGSIIASLKEEENLKIKYLGGKDASIDAVLRVLKTSEYFDIFHFAGRTEFNMYIDPEAAKSVLKSGLQVLLVPLDVTTKALLMPIHLEKVKASNTPIGDYVEKIIRPYLDAYMEVCGYDGCSIHDPVAVAIDTSLAKFERLFVDVEAKGELTLGQTIADLRIKTKNKRHNSRVQVCYDMNLSRFMEMFLGMFK